MNELMFFVCVVCCLGGVLFMYKVAGQRGLYAFAVFGTLIGNIAVCKCITLFGLETTGGNVIYAATFLTTDILSEFYGKKAASRAVKYSFITMLMWLVGTQLILLFAPSESDYVNESLKVIFGLAPRITGASLCGFLCSQNIDVFLYHYIWKKSGDTKKKLWLRNNGSTLTSQAIDTLIFTTLAFYGTYPTPVFISIVITTYVFKAGVALLDTPFIYLAGKLKPMEE